MLQRNPFPKHDFEDPGAIVASPALSVASKLELLQRWAFDERELEVAEGEGMPCGSPTRLGEVIASLLCLRQRHSRLHVLSAWLLLGSLGASLGCQALDPYTGQPRVNKTTKGAAVGTLAGAAAGALSGHDSESRRKRALIGAGVGALAGAVAGAYMDRQEARLRAELAASGVSVTREGDSVVLNMPGDVTFATNSADLRADFYGVLNSVAKVATEFDKTMIRVTGYTDDTGSTELNQSLSERRADTVARYLVAHQVNELRVQAVGAGESQPVASNGTPEGRQQNRRVELVLMPLTEPA